MLAGSGGASCAALGSECVVKSTVGGLVNLPAIATEGMLWSACAEIAHSNDLFDVAM